MIFQIMYTFLLCVIENRKRGVSPKNDFTPSVCDIKSKKTLSLILYRRQVVEGVTECTLNQGEFPKANYLPPVKY